MKKRLLSLALCLALCLGLLPVGVLAEEGGGFYVPPGSHTEGGGGTYTPPEDTRAEIWCVSKPDSIGRGYDGTTDGSTIPIDLTFTDGTDTFTLKEGTGFTAKKTFDSADAGWHTVTVEITLIGEAAAKYKLKAGEEKFEIGGNINKAYPKLNVSLSRTTCTVGEKILPLLSVEGAPEDAEVTYYYLAAELKNWAGSSDAEGGTSMPAIDGNTAISEPGTYYVYAKTGATKNYEEERSTTVELTVAEKVDPVASVTTANGTETPYDSFSDAWTAATASAESTLKLLADATLPNTNTDLGQSLTLDLNGYVLGSNGSLTVKSGAALTVTNAGGEKSKNPIKVGLYLNLLVEKGGSFTCTDGGLRYLGLLSAGTDDYAIQLTEGESHCTFGGFAQGDANATVGDLLKATPGMALYGDYNGSDVRIERSTRINSGFTYLSFYVGPCSEHQMDAKNGTCIYCGASYVASVTTSDDVITNYTSLDDALDAMKDGDTITLLSDAAVTRWHSLSKAFTLELNGKTVTTQSTAELYLHARVIVQDSSTGKTGGMAGTYLLNVQSNGDLIIRSGTFNGRIAINDGKLTINGGTFNQEVALPRGNSDSVFFSGGTFAKIWYPNSSGSFLDLLAYGCAFYDNNDQLVNAANSTGRYLYNVKVKEHQHSFTDGACACGYTCPHTSVAANGACTVCHKQIAASVTAGEDVTYYDTFGSALSYATRNDGCTLKLLADVTGTTVMINNPFIFDLNGHSVDALSVDAKATIKDSGTTKGRIGKVTVFNEKVTDLTLGSLLEEGYGFKYGNGYWANDSYLQTSEGSFVTVEKAPIQSVNVYAKDKNNKEVSTTIAYGTTGEVTLVSSCQLSETSGGELSCAWYKLTDDAAIPPLEGATGTSYTLPADLPAGTHTYLVTFTSDYYSKSAEITITVTKIDLANATVTIDPWYTDGKVRFNPYAPETAALSFLSTVKVTANGKEDKLSASDFTCTGATATQVGNYKLTITATDSCANYKGSKTFDWEVIPYQLFRPIFQGSQTYTKTYDGTTTLPGSYTWLAEFFGREGTDQNVTLKSGDYEVTAAEFVSADAGENKPINQTITLKNDNFVFYPTEIVNVKGITTADKTLTYTNFTPTEAYPTGGTTFNIEKATMPDFNKEVTLDIVNNHADTYTVDLSALLPKLESPRTYGEIEYSQPTVQLASGYYTDGHAKVENGKLILTIDKNPVTTTGPIGTVTVQVTTTNYKPVTLAVNLRSVNKQRLGMFVSVATDPIVYGMTLGDIKLSAEATVDKQVIPGTIAWEDPLTTVPAAGRATYRWIFTPDDTMHYLTASNTITFLVDKATPTGAPTYTAITTSGKTLKDAGLTVNENWPEGSIHWVDANGTEMDVDTAVSANTAYTWKFVPTDTDNYNDLTGTITLWHKSSSGSSSGAVTPGTKTDTVKNPDGSTTKTETKADGSKTETTTASSGGGSTGTTVTKTDAKGNTTTEASAKLSDRDVKEAQEKGEAVTVPVKGIAAAKDANAATKIKIDVPNNANKTTVEIPVENVTSGTVAVIVHEDGTEELVKDSKPTEHGVQLELSGSTTVKIIDNSKTFDDTKGHWSRDEVNFVAARELFNGVGGNQFGVSQPMTRGMVNTVLARLAGVDTTPGQGQAWYEVGTDWAKKNGISDGTNPTAPVTREQLATLLYRYAGSPSVSGTLHAADAASVSDYAEDALLWANQNGIVNGVGSNTIAPKDNAQRAQVAAMLARYLQNQ